MKTLQVIQTGYSRILKSVKKFEESTGNVKAKAKIEIKESLKDYANDIIILINNKDLAEDPFHVIYGKGFKFKFMIYQLFEALYELRDKNEELSGAIDNIMSIAAERGIIQKWIILFQDGKRIIINNKNVKVIINGTIRAYKWTKDMLSNFTNWIKGLFIKEQSVLV